MRKEMLLISLLICILTVTPLSSAPVQCRPALLSVLAKIDVPLDRGCGVYSKSLAQAINLYRKKQALQLGFRNGVQLGSDQAKAEGVGRQGLRNRSQMEEIVKKQAKKQKTEPTSISASYPSYQNITDSTNFARSPKQELTSSFRHQSSQIGQMLQSQILLQTQKLHQSAQQNCITPSQLMVWLGLLGLASAAIAYAMVEASRRQREQLKNQLACLQSQKEAVRLNLNKQIEVLRQKTNFYEVFWDRLVDRVQDKKCYDHLIYEGRFLSQQTYVYVVKMQEIDIRTVQRKLKKLLTCSHSRLSKLYFYVKEGEHLLAFTEKIVPLASQQLPQFLNVNASEQSKRTLITEIIETIDYLQAKIQLKWLPLHSIQLNYQPNREVPSFEFKINAIPCLFRKMPNTCGDDENDTCPEDIPCFVRTNIAALFHLILMNGRALNPSQLKKMQETNEEYVQFLSFILHQARAVGHTHQLLFKQVKQHPFLWDTTRKILFISDFSNFIETHLDDQKIEKLEEYAQLFNVVETNWGKPFHFLFAQEINNYRKYDFSSMRDLVRMIRNKLNHFHQIPKEVRTYVGRTPQKFMEYCLMKFPKLLYFAYNYTRKKKWRLHVK